MRPMDKLDRIHLAQAEEDKKKFVKKLHKIEERAKIKQIEFEEEISQRKIRALKEYLESLFVKKTNLAQQEKEKRMLENAQLLLNVI